MSIKVIITKLLEVFLLRYGQSGQLHVRYGLSLKLGLNCPGVITQEEAQVGIRCQFCFKKGTVGLLFSKSGTLTYEAADQVVRQGLGITTAIWYWLGDQLSEQQQKRGVGIN